MKLGEYLKMKKMYTIRLEAKMNAWVIDINFLLFKEKIMFKSHLLKLNHRVLGKNKVDTYGAPVL